MSKTILGLDLGEASIGFALIEEIADGANTHSMGSRVFQSAIEDKTKDTSRNVKRRSMRSARRNRERRTRRLSKLINQLIRTELLPADATERKVVLGIGGASLDSRYIDPYALRAKALDEKLEPYELGRVLHHLGQRRGFLSNKKASVAEILGLDEEGPADDDLETTDEEKEGIEAVQRLTEAITTSNARTLGEFLHREKSSGRKIRGTDMRPSRKMYLEEFDAIWQSQTRWHASVLTKHLYSQIQETFFQRPLKVPRAKLPRRTLTESEAESRSLNRRVGGCKFYIGRPAARVDHFFAHRMRILQTLRNIRYDDAKGDPTPLSNETVQSLAQKLQSQKSMTWAGLRKEAKLPKGSVINFERGKEKGIEGNRTESFLNDILGDKWNSSYELSAEDETNQLELMQDIDTAPNLKNLFDTLQRPKKDNPIYPLSRDQALAIVKHTFRKRPVAYSVRALRKLSKALYEKAQSTHHAEVEENEAIERPVFDSLPIPPRIPNPRVQRALFEVRKVVNAVIEKHGKPDEIVIELARDMRLSPKEKERLDKQQTANRARNKQAADFFAAHAIEPSRTQVLTWRLWDDQGQECPYTGRNIPAALILGTGGDLEIDHILPLPRSGDDSFTNKVLTFREVNADKGNRTPKEWLGNRPDEWFAATERIKRQSNHGRLKKFLNDNLPADGGDFVARQLQDTRYMGTAARQYLECLGIPVRVTNGQATAMLRRTWGLNNLIPVRETQKELPPSEKHRTDHRHHAVDALVIALTNPKRYLEALCIRDYRAEPSKPPVERQKIQQIVDRIQTSHDLDKGIKGGLHDEMFYGRQLDESGSARYVRRVPIRTFAKDKYEDAAKDITEKVYDSDMRAKLLAHLQAIGNPKEAFGHDSITLTQAVDKPMTVKNIRIRHKLTDKGMHDLGGGRHVQPNSNHHGEIVKNRKGKLECRAVRMIDAARRVRSERRSPYGIAVGDGETFVMSISIGEIVECNGMAMRVSTISDGDVRLRDLNDARSGETGVLRFTSSDKFASITAKLRIDPIGNLTYEDGRPYPRNP